MPTFRSIVSVFLVLVTTLLVSCSNPQSSKIPTTYSPEKIEQLQIYVKPLNEALEQMSVLQESISKQNWIDTRTIIHGPLGQLRKQMLDLCRSLLPKDQKQATDLARDVFADFERLDAAAQAQEAYPVESAFRQAARDLEAFLDLIPQA